MNIATTKKRILQLIDIKGDSKAEFLRKTGIRRGFLDADKLGSSVNDVFLAKIIASYPDINTEWLLTGQGNMLKSAYQFNNKPSQVAEPEITLHRLKTDYFKQETHPIPLYEIEASAGLATLFSSQVQQIPLDTITIPNAPACDGAIRVSGDSMYPLLKSGDIVCYSTIHDKNNIYWGEMYLLYLETDGNHFLTVKYLQKSDKGDNYIKMVSHNEHHNPKDEPTAHIKALAIVKISVRYNTMG